MIVCIVRPLLFKGQRVEAGQQLDVEPAEVAELLSTTRARLLNPADGPAVFAARQAATKAAMRKAGRPPAWLEVAR